MIRSWSHKDLVEEDFKARKQKVQGPWDELSVACLKNVTEAGLAGK